MGIVTKPFAFEGRRRMEQAEKGIAALREQVDSLVVIPNERLKLVSEERITLANAFIVADDVLRQGVQSISDLIQLPGIVNLDFEDVKSVCRTQAMPIWAWATPAARIKLSRLPWLLFPAPCWKPRSPVPRA